MEWQQRRAGWNRVAIGVFILILLGGLAAMSLRYRLGPAWALNLNLSRVQIIAGTSEQAQCPALGPGICMGGSGVVEKTFVVWVVRRRVEPSGEVLTARRVVVYPAWVCTKEGCTHQQADR